MGANDTPPYEGGTRTGDAEAGSLSVLKDGEANRQRGIEAVGGWLALTPESLIFASHHMNLKKGVLRLPLTEIASVRPSWTRLLTLLPIVPNAIAVQTWPGDLYRFTVTKRHEWSTAIEEVRRLAASKP
jgi:hypothetical protein